MIIKIFRHVNNQIGMTLVELVIIIGIYTVLMGAISTSIVYLYQANGYTFAQSNEIDHARRGLQDWIRDTREMTYADDGTFPIAVMEQNRIGFYSDVDKESSVEYVEYSLSTTTLYKRTYKPVGSPPVYNLVTPVKIETVSEYVQNAIMTIPVFTYYDTNGDLLSSTSSLLTDVRYIEARIIVNIDPLRSPGEFLLHNGISPRNLKDNL